MSALMKDLREYWVAIEPVLSIRNEAEYEIATARIDALIDEGALDPAHPLHGLLNVLGTLLHTYEEIHQPMPAVSGAQILRFLMEQHGLKETDLSEIGPESAVAEVLSGARVMNVQQRTRLAERFNVPADVFLSG